MTESPDGSRSGQGLSPEAQAVLDDVAPLLGRSPFALLSGAGLSTDSGIPDYRGPHARPRTPVTYQEFTGDSSVRRRYWARNHLGWSLMRQARPNAGHLAVAALERAGALAGTITQNVDRLHEAAGTANVVDLHGRFDRVVCLQCGRLYARQAIAVVLEELNPGFLTEAAADGGAPAAPDADADLEHRHLIETFVVPGCPVCGGMLKPDVVFFGENVPVARVERAFGMLEAAGSLLVAGSSLAVMSGLRFVRRAARDGKPVVIINRGATRGDGLADIKLDAGVGESLEYLARAVAERFAQAPRDPVQ